MSFQVVAWAIDQPLKGIEKSILLALAWRDSWNNPGAGCFPSLDRIALDTGWSQTTVKKFLNKLIAKGIVEKESRFENGVQKTNRFRIVCNEQINGNYLNRGGRNTTRGGRITTAEGARARLQEQKLNIRREDDPNNGSSRGSNSSRKTTPTPEGFSSTPPKKEPRFDQRMHPVINHYKQRMKEQGYHPAVELADQRQLKQFLKHRPKIFVGEIKRTMDHAFVSDSQYQKIQPGFHLRSFLSNYNTYVKGPIMSKNGNGSSSSKKFSGDPEIETFEENGFTYTRLVKQ